jgi:hypothetical protein
MGGRAQPNSQCGPTIEEWKSMRELGILPSAELGQAEAMAAAIPKCRS